ncbi:SAM-dependent methyltransferase [Nocardia miyunensis]|uniref:SAM-dependent methyltransferase n=1 Tax=Nocardia miyunensis TaxID=282684 RepID=UPI000835043D|nr:SAM-dependent methyltransferase [Nocardia miyunensis]
MDFDPGRATSARIHDFLLEHGKDTYPPDRRAGEMLLSDAPDFRTAVREARRFALRAIENLVAGHGVRQIVELGSGLPYRPNMHEVALRADPGVRTLYIDADPHVAVHGRVFLDGDRSHMVCADLGDTGTVVRRIRETMNLHEPVALILSSVLEFIADPRAIIDPLMAELPGRTLLVLSHVAADVGNAEAVVRAVEIYQEAGITLWPRSSEEIAALLTGCDLLEPGLVPANRWRPGQTAPPHDVCCLAAVGRSR